MCDTVYADMLNIYRKCLQKHLLLWDCVRVFGGFAAREDDREVDMVDSQSIGTK